MSVTLNKAGHMSAIQGDDQTLFERDGLSITQNGITWRGVEIAATSVSSAGTGGTYGDLQLGEFGSGAIGLAAFLGLASQMSVAGPAAPWFLWAAIALTALGASIMVANAVRPRRGLHVRTKSGDEIWLRLAGFKRADVRRVSDALQVATFAQAGARRKKTQSAAWMRSTTNADG